MQDVISFGAVWTAWYRGWHISFTRKGAIKTLREHPEEFRFHFGRNVEELVECIPSQVTWMNEDPMRQVFDPDEVITPEHLDPNVLSRWLEFNQLLLLPAVAEQRIRWGLATNYYDYAKLLVAQGRSVANYLG